MTLEQFNKLIPKILNGKLGGIEAQFKIAPTYREKYDLDVIKSKKPKNAAVLMLIFPDSENQMRFLLTKRPDYSGFHANQISFTGGKKDQLDADLLQTALRETKEEINHSIFPEQVIKSLTEVYIPPSDFLVQPYLAFTSSTPTFQPNYEVKELITPTLLELLNPNIEYREIRGANGKIWNSPGFVFGNDFVWGATAMILSEVLDLFNSI